MRKLLKLKKFITLPEVADYLSQCSGEKINVLDILQLSHEGHFCLHLNVAERTPAFRYYWDENSKEKVYLCGVYRLVSDDKGFKYRVQENFENSNYRIYLENADLILDENNDLYSLDGALNDKIIFKSNITAMCNNVVVVKSCDLTSIEKYFTAKEMAVNCNDRKLWNPKSFESLLKLIIIMAVDGYKYDKSKSKNDVHSEISEAAEKMNLKIDVDTVRKWLKEASNLLDQDSLTS